MQPPHLLLFLFLPLLLPGMQGDPEAQTQVFQLLQTSSFTNISSAEVSGVAFLGDVPIYTLDPANWSIHFYWPWASQAAAEGDVGKIKSHSKLFLRSMVRFVHETAQQAQLDYPFVVQVRGGCGLYPNRTSWSFMDVGESGRDLITFEMERQRWKPQQSSLLAELVSKSLTSKAIIGLLEHILSISCQSHILSLCRYGRADLERQVPPVAVVFARTPSPAQLLLVCRVTGFYPRPISVAWLRDGQEVPPGPALNTSAILPNADLTYQLRSILAVTPHDGHSYACRVRHSSLGSRSLLIPWGKVTKPHGRPRNPSFEAWLPTQQQDPSLPSLPAHLMSHPGPISTNKGLLWKTTTLNSYKLSQLHVALTFLPHHEVLPGNTPMHCKDPI
ncbi:antigen-presenting glycoprotein CD1d isoform X1 [Falco cherrug]|uniref:antigen-presenting glycoprotein CD1d isoform X1 n=1 Tax=Falco cherrug TaxID=345164 RepID=UPI00247B0EA4|nr:antigen-presenting glycoprotein CD1d isoform X1 [Falco cherrug]